MSRGTWRLIATGVAAVVLAGCQVTVDGTGHPAPDQAQPATDTGSAEDPPAPVLEGTATCEVPTPPDNPDGSGTIVRVEVEGTGDALNITIELSDPPADIQELGVEVNSYGDLLDVGVEFTNGSPPFQYTFDSYTGELTRLPTSPIVDGTTVTYTVPANVFDNVAPEFRWYAYNFASGQVDACPPIPPDGSGQTTVNFPPL